MSTAISSASGLRGPLARHSVRRQGSAGLRQTSHHLGRASRTPIRSSTTPQPCSNILRSAAALLTGKLAMVELAGGPSYRYASASLTGPGLNPWDIHALVRRIVQRLGHRGRRRAWSPTRSDRKPPAPSSRRAHSAASPDLRPTYGLVSRHGAMALSWTLDKIGPICRSAEDCGLVLEAIAGARLRRSRLRRARASTTRRSSRAISKMFASASRPSISPNGVDPAARADYAKALDTIRSLGVQVTEAKLPDFPYGPLISTIISAGRLRDLRTADQKRQGGSTRRPTSDRGLKAGLEIPAKDYLKAHAHPCTHARSLPRPAFAPRTCSSPPRDSILHRRSRSHWIVAPTIVLTPVFGALIPAGNLAGLPALSLPCGFANGMPMGLQLVGSPFSENMLLAIGKTFQDRTDWHKRRPPIAS